MIRWHGHNQSWPFIVQFTVNRWMCGVCIVCALWKRSLRSKDVVPRWHDLVRPHSRLYINVSDDCVVWFRNERKNHDLIEVYVVRVGLNDRVSCLLAAICSMSLVSVTQKPNIFRRKAHPDPCRRKQHSEHDTNSHWRAAYSSILLMGK